MNLEQEMQLPDAMGKSVLFDHIRTLFQSKGFLWENKMSKWLKMCPPAILRLHFLSHKYHSRLSEAATVIIDQILESVRVLFKVTHAALPILRIFCHRI